MTQQTTKFNDSGTVNDDSYVINNSNSVADITHDSASSTMCDMMGKSREGSFDIHDDFSSSNSMEVCTSPDISDLHVPMSSYQHTDTTITTSQGNTTSSADNRNDIESDTLVNASKDVSSVPSIASSIPGGVNVNGIDLKSFEKEMERLRAKEQHLKVI
jgi:hypothetical protein